MYTVQYVCVCVDSCTSSDDFASDVFICFLEIVTLGQVSQL